MYRGSVGQGSWILHRITGVGVFLFLLIHIVDTALVVVGPDLYNKVVAFYNVPLFRLMEVGLLACLLYHALNGIRICLFDFWPKTTPYYRTLFNIQMGIFAVSFLVTAWMMLKPIWKAGP